ncbi:MAG: hypothetical protein CVT60_03050 [Actinobacteria bacterium HGW-Actinobacteria-10]|jgi:cell wall-associated NlpC family hydrolase|nr:MAG: hypothetical protein CVT60_03050 [Actinobacteria bacterium HGW-Actinobacteria-10]
MVTYDVEDEILSTKTTRLAAIALILLLAMATAPAFGVPSKSDKLSEARRVKAQIETLDHQVEVAAEQYNEAAETHAALVSRIKSTQAELDKANARITALQGHLSVRATSMYRSGPVGIVEVLLGANDFDEFAATWDFLKNLNEQEAESVSELKETRAKAERYKKDLSDQEAAAAKTVDRMTANKTAIQAKLNDRKRMLAGLESEIAAIEAAEAASEARALAAARAEADRAASRKVSAVTPSRTFPAPTRAARGEVVDIARRYLGAPYRWGASGPNSFDCSGFTMFVYSQVGVSLPHSSRAQYGSGQRVSRADLQPGDLVFFGSPIHHVGIYVGGGAYIHAPRTGDVVKISSLSRGDYAGACRP